MLHKQRLLTCEITRRYGQRKMQRWQKQRRKKTPLLSSTLKTNQMRIFPYELLVYSLNKLYHIPCIQVTIFWGTWCWNRRRTHCDILWICLQGDICIFGPVPFFLIYISKYLRRFRFQGWKTGCTQDGRCTKDTQDRHYIMIGKNNNRKQKQNRASIRSSPFLSREVWANLSEEDRNVFVPFVSGTLLRHGSLTLML